MAVKIGIPRAMMYYEYIPLWKRFFEEIGAEIVLSEHTTKNILNDGVKNCIDEACLPVKIFHGHVMNLKDRVDYLFIPRLTSVAYREYICPKVGGLPDMIKYSISGLPPIIDTEINLRNIAFGKPERALLKAFERIGGYVTRDKKIIKRAFELGMDEYRNFQKSLLQGYLPDEGNSILKVKNSELNIAIIGHVYNLYDSFINMNLLKRLQRENIHIITPENLPEEEIIKRADTLPKKMYWTFGKRLLGSVLYIIEQNDIDGIIYIMSFGCGIDAFVADISERRVRRETDIPFFLITLDEHSGEAGFNTRIEAFIDLIKRRKRLENNLSAYG